MITIKILPNSGTDHISAFAFMAGESSKTLRFQLWDTETQSAPAVGTATVKTITLPSAAATDITITDASVNQETTKSIFNTVISSTNLALMQTGFLRFTWTESGAIKKASAQLVIKKIV